MEPYLQTRAQMVALVTEHRAATDTSVPACPSWTIHDVVAHVTGLAADLVARNLDGYASERWTAAQVDARRQRSTSDVVDEWEALPLAPLLEKPQDHGLPEVMPVVATVDLLTHLHDVREALQLPVPDRPDPAAELALRSLVADLRTRTGHLPSLRIEATGLRDFLVGRHEPAVTLTTTPYELARALTGRRTRQQVADLDWSGDPAPYLDVLLPPYFSWPEADGT